MKLGKVRIGERFVYDDRGGVFQRVSWEKARCIYGSGFGVELDINPEMSVYAIFDKEKSTRINKHEVPVDTGMVAPAEVNTAEVQESVAVPVNAPAVVQDHLVESEGYVGIVCQPPMMSLDSGLRVVFTDDKDRVINEIACVSSAEVSALLRSDFIKLKVGGSVKVFHVVDVGYDTDEKTLYLSVERND